MTVAEGRKLLTDDINARLRAEAATMPPGLIPLLVGVREVIKDDALMTRIVATELKGNQLEGI